MDRTIAAEPAASIPTPRVASTLRGHPCLLQALAPPLALLLASLIWLPAMHFIFAPKLSDCYRPDGRSIPPLALELAQRHLRLWSDPALRAEEVKRMRASNAEWDFMGRTFFVLSLANMALREPAREKEHLRAIDTIVDETRKLEAEHGPLYFMMDYARGGHFSDPSGRSLFIDGEIAMMIGARLSIAPKPDLEAPLRECVGFILAQMGRGPLLCGESYPNECWMFCNAAALAAVRMADAHTGEDHSAFIERWLASVRAHLVEPKTGLLDSSFDYEGRVFDGPEGSSIWWVSHCLELLDPAFARDQYDRARRELGTSICGFGFAREWPASWKNTYPDIDSGPIIPVLHASAGSSGQAFMAAAAFGDEKWLAQLLTSLNLAAFPTRDAEGGLSYRAGNQVGDAVLLYSLVQGPLWSKVSTDWTKHANESKTKPLAPAASEVKP